LIRYATTNLNMFGRRVTTVASQIGSDPARPADGHDKRNEDCIANPRTRRKGK
jgi:hypothetical protein